MVLSAMRYFLSILLLSIGASSAFAQYTISSVEDYLLTQERVFCTTQTTLDFNGIFKYFAFRSKKNEKALTNPCSCTNQENYNLNDLYYFKETTEITSRTAEQWNITTVSSGSLYDANGNTISLPFAGTESPTGSGIYQWEFWHLDGEGFCVEYAEVNTNETMEDCNACSLPEVNLPISSINLGTYFCNALQDIPSCPTSVGELIASPYNVTLSSRECDDIFRMACLDSETISCDGTDQTITRTVFLFIDQNRNESFDSNEKLYSIPYSYTVIPGPIELVCNSQLVRVNRNGATTIDPENLVTPVSGFCSSNLSYTATINSFDCSDLNGSITNTAVPVTVTVEDDCNNIGSCTANVSLKLDYMQSNYPSCLCGVLSSRDFSKAGVDYFYKLEFISGTTSQRWNLVSFEDSDVYSEFGKKLSMPMPGIHIGCGIYLWEYWHTNTGKISAVYQDEVTGRQVRSVN